ncbi:unnamed protein product, partial [Rotaria sordida]
MNVRLPGGVGAADRDA